MVLKYKHTKNLWMKIVFLMVLICSITTLTLYKQKKELDFLNISSLNRTDVNVSEHEKHEREPIIGGGGRGIFDWGFAEKKEEIHHKFTSNDEKLFKIEVALEHALNALKKVVD